MQPALEADKIRRGQVDVPEREKLEMLDGQQGEGKGWNCGSPREHPG